jgi:hypothetical protein
VINRFLLHVAACATALMVFPATGAAQTPAASFDALRGVVRNGDHMIVTESDGRRTSGTVMNVTPSSLDLKVDTCRIGIRILCRSALHSVSASATISITRIDSPREGGLIGLAAGFASSYLLVCNNNYFSDNYPRDGSCASAVILVALPMGGLGAVIGAFIDSRRNETVYRASAPALGGVTVSLSPVLTGNGTGALLTVQF